MFLRRNFLCSIGSIFGINLFDKPKEDLVKQDNANYFVTWQEKIVAISDNKQYAEDFAALWNFDRIMGLLHYSHNSKSEFIACDVLMSPEYFLSILKKYCDVKKIKVEFEPYENMFDKRHDYALDHSLSLDEVKKIMSHVKCPMPIKVTTNLSDINDINSRKMECILLNDIDCIFKYGFTFKRRKMINNKYIFNKVYD